MKRRRQTVNKKEDDSNTFYLYLVIAIMIIGSLVGIMWYGSPDTRLLKAVKTCEAETAKNLLAKGANANVRTPEEGDVVNDAPAIFFAARDGCADILTLLLTHHADINAKVSGRHYPGWTALMAASENGHTSIVHFLLKHNADVTLKTDNDKTALQLAEAKGYKDIIQLLKNAVGNK